MSLYEFATESPWLTFFIVWMITALIFRCWNRLLRHLSVRRRGWPPEHLDADGDWMPKDDG